MIKLFNNNNSNLSVKLFQKVWNTYNEVTSLNSVPFSSSKKFKISFYNYSSLLNQKIYSASVSFLFSSLASGSTLTLSDGNNNVIDIVNTDVNSSAFRSIEPFVLVTFDITSHILNSISNGVISDLFISISSMMNGIFGYSFINDYNSNSSLDSRISFINFYQREITGIDRQVDNLEFEVGNSGTLYLSAPTGDYSFLSPLLVGNFATSSYMPILCFNPQNNSVSRCGLYWNLPFFYQVTISTKEITLIDYSNNKRIFTKLEGSYKEKIFKDETADIFYCYSTKEYLKKESNSSIYEYFSEGATYSLSLSQNNSLARVDSISLKNGDLFSFAYDETYFDMIESIVTPDDEIVFDYESGLLISVESTKKGLISEVSYNNGVISNIISNKIDIIPYTNGTETEETVRDTDFLYQNGYLVEISNQAEKRKINLQLFSDNKVQKIIEQPLIENITSDNIRETTYEYFDNYFIVTNPAGQKTYEYFDEYLSKKVVINENGVGEIHNYTKIEEDPNYREIHDDIGKYAFYMANHNLVVNPSFETSIIDSGWTNSDSQYLLSYRSFECVSDGHSILLVNSGNQAQNLSQELTTIKDGTYIFRGYYKKVGTNLSQYSANIVINYDEVIVESLFPERITIIPRTISRTINLTKQDEFWHSFESEEFILPKDAEVTISLVVPSNGSIQFDDITFSEKNLFGTDNFIRNPSFETLNTNSTPYDWTTTGSFIMCYSSNIANECPFIRNNFGSNTLTVSSSSTPSQRNISQELHIKGDGGEILTLVSWIKSNFKITEDIFIRISIHYVKDNSGVFDNFVFKGLPHCSNWQVITGTIVTKSVYDQLIIELVCNGTSEVSFDYLKLYKSVAGDIYEFSDTGEKLFENYGSQETDISLNIKHLPSVKRNRYGEHTMSTYNENDKVDVSFDNYGNTLEMEYAEGEVTKIVTASSQSIVTKQEIVDGKIVLTDEFNHQTQKGFNEFGNEIYFLDEKGTAVRKTYDEHFRLKEIERTNLFNSLGNTDFTYDENGNLSSIALDDVEYSFSYDYWNRRNESYINGCLIERNFYETASSAKTNQPIRKQILSDNTYTISFNYSNDALSTISINNVTEYYFHTNVFGQIVEWKNSNGISQSIIDYDYKGHVNKEIWNNGFCVNNVYDNLDNLKSSVLNIEESFIKQTHTRDYELNQISLFDFLADLNEIYDADFVIGSLRREGVYGLKKLSGSCSLTADSELNRKVLKLNFNNKIKYDLTTINSEKTISKTKYRNTKSDESSEDGLSFTGWFNLEFNYTNKRLLSFGNENNEELIKINLDSLGYLSIEIGNNDQQSYNYSVYLPFQTEWTMVTVNIHPSNTNGQGYVELYLNSFLIGKLYASSSLTNEITFLSIGSGTFGNTNLAFKIAYFTVEKHLLNADDNDTIFNTSALTLSNKLSSDRYKKTSIEIFDNEELDYISLDGVLSSIRGVNPIYSMVYDNRKVIGNRRCFMWDDGLKRLVYASFNESYHLLYSQLNGLTYDLNLNDYLFLSFDYKLINLGYTIGTRTLFCLSNHDSSTIIEIYLDGSTIKVRKDVSIETVTTIQNLYIWNHISSVVTPTSISFYNSEGTLIHSMTYSQTSISGAHLSIGYSPLGGGFAYLNGCIKDVYYSLNQMPSSISHDRYEILSKHDTFGRLTKKTTNSIERSYLYERPLNDEGQEITSRTTKRVKQENDSIIGTIQYSYDLCGNVISINKNNNETNYSYDYCNRLTSSTDGTSSTEYVYDNNGNILSIIQKTNNVIVHQRTFTYDNDHGNRLSEIEYDQDTISITYNNNQSLYPTSVGNMNFSWKANLLKTLTIGQDIYYYKYDYQGRRISKTFGNSSTKYFYNEDRLILETNLNGNIAYFYDDNKQPLGFIIYQNQTKSAYFYVKDIFGVIHKIVDENNQVVATYTYDDYGALLSSTGNSTVLSFNHLLYKGYYYDFESEMYLLGKRYYYPFICRFISPDDIEFLLVETANYEHFNLFSYCYNNPILYSDDSGNFVLTIILGIISLVTTLVAAVVGIVVHVLITTWYAVLISAGAETFYKQNDIGKSISDIFDFFCSTGKLLGLFVLTYLTSPNSKAHNYFLSEFHSLLRYLETKHTYALSSIVDFTPTILAIFSGSPLLESTYEITLRITLKELAKNNFVHNTQMWHFICDNSAIANDVFAIGTNYINDQQANYMKDVNCGFSNIDNSGCGIIACYNALIFLNNTYGRSIFPSVIYEFDKSNYTFGFIGGTPTQVSQFLINHSITHTLYFNKTELSGIMVSDSDKNIGILLLYANTSNSSNEARTMHYIFIVKDENKNFTTYNYGSYFDFSNGLDAFCKSVDEEYGNNDKIFAAGIVVRKVSA